MNISPSGSLSSVPSGRIIDFDVAELRKVPFQDSLYLWVRGTLPGIGFEARLAPRVYQIRPDYWGIEVAVVVHPEPANDSTVDGTSLDFERSVPLAGITGVRGIAVIGANQIKRIDRWRVLKRVATCRFGSGADWRQSAPALVFGRRRARSFHQLRQRIDS